MARTVESRQLLYAMTSAQTSDEANISGIGVIIKAARRHTLRKISSIIPTADCIIAAYEGIATALREARKMGARAIVVHTDNEGIVNQLQKKARVDTGQLARHLETRSLLNQFHRAEIKLIPPEENEAARGLAVQALREASDNDETKSQLSLPMADTGTG